MTSSRRIHRRALVVLGALLLVLYMWPFICVAAIPVPSMRLFHTAAPPVLAQRQHISHVRSNQSTPIILHASHGKPSAINHDYNTSNPRTMFNVLNDTTREDMKSTPNDPVVSTSYDVDGSTQSNHQQQTLPTSFRPLITDDDDDDDGNNRVASATAFANTVLRRTMRSTRRLINTSGAPTECDENEEIAFKIKPTSTQTDLNLNTTRHPTTTITQTIDLSDLSELHEHTADDVADVAEVADVDGVVDAFSTTTSTNRAIGPRTMVDTLSASVGQWTTESNDSFTVDTDSTAIAYNIEFVEVATALTIASSSSSASPATADAAGTRRRGASRNNRSINQPSASSGSRKRNSHVERNERSANLSHIMGTVRKIQLLMKNRLIQILPDGTVNGTQDDQSEYSK